MIKQQLLGYMAQLLSEVRDPKTFLLRSLTVVVLLLGWLVINNPDAILKYANEMTRDAIVETLEKERLAKAPTIAKERVSLIYGQVYADLVYVATYEPKQQNDYLKITAKEGDVSDTAWDTRTKLVVRKASKMYNMHLASRNFFYGIEDTSYDSLLFNTSAIRDGGIHYLFTCPIYSLDNIYAGHIGIGYRQLPEKLPQGFLESVCTPNARAIGRHL